MNEAIQIAQQKTNKTTEQIEISITEKFMEMKLKTGYFCKTFRREEALANCELTGKTQFM